MLKKVTDDIYLLSVPIPFGMQQVNCYLFRGEKGFTVIDTGSYAQEGIDVWENLMTLGMTIEKVVLTHFHIDHIGLARWFQEKHHIPIFISSLGYREMKRRQKKEYTDWVIHLFKQHGGPDLSTTATEEYTYIYGFEPDGLLGDGQPIMLGNERYEALWTPGHSSDHYCFYHHEREIMMIGDHVLEHLSPVILAESPSDVNPLMNYFKSLEKVEGYSIKLALPGHGNLIGNVHKRIEEIKSGHHYRMEQILESIKSEEKTAGQLSQETYSKGSNTIAFSPLMATITRCIYLESIGKLKSEMINGKRLYRLAD